MRRVIARIGANGYEPPPATEGDAERMADIIATRTVPLASTDSTFMEGFGCHDDGLQGEGADLYRRRYKRATGSMPSGKRYMSQLARFPGDPRAWVSSTSEVLSICKEDNLNWEHAGRVRHKAVDYEVPDDKPYEVAPDLIEKRVAKAIEANPDLKHQPKKLEAKREEIKAKAVGRMGKP